MRTIAHQITILLLFISLSAFSNNETDTILNSPKNDAVEHIIQLRKKGGIEESIKAGLKFLASKTQIYLKDSLRISRTLAFNLETIDSTTHTLKDVYFDSGAVLKKAEKQYISWCSNSQIFVLSENQNNT